MRIKLFLTRHWSEAVERYLAERYDLTVNEKGTAPSERELAEIFATFDAVCPTVSDRISAQVLSAGAGRLKILGNYGVGVSHIDLEACRRLGIVVTNTPDVLTESTADLTITLMLMVARRAGEGDRLVRSGNWNGWRPTHMLGTDVTGKTLGLIGFGRIGQAVAVKAQRAFGMRVLYHSRRRVSTEVEATCGARYCATVDEVLAGADVLSLNCPGGAETRHLLNAQRLGRMKPTAFLINTSRGEVVDEKALVDALQRGVIAGAGLDVYEHEPQVEPALLSLENVVLLPHLGSATVETRIAMGMRVAQNLERFFAGLEPGDRVA